MTRELTYRNCAIGGASPIGLLLALFDRLAADLGRAAAAIRDNNIEARCNEINHALLIVGQLESWVDPEKGGESARMLVTYYRHLRAKMMEASARQSAEILASLVESILTVRSSWQSLDSAPAENAAPSNSTYRAPFPYGGYDAPDHVSFSQSA